MYILPQCPPGRLYIFFICHRNIKRIIFYSLVKPNVNEKGEKEIDIIPAFTALQIAGRAGRYGTTWDEGEVTTFKGTDLPQLKKLLNTKIEPVEVSSRLWEYLSSLYLRDILSLAV